MLPPHDRCDMTDRDTFFEEEKKALIRRNSALSEAHLDSKEEMERRRTSSRSLVVTCMDERNTFVEESLGLLPGEALTLGSGGGRITADEVEGLYGDWLRDAPLSVVYLVMHECVEDPSAGCAAFSSDVLAQEVYFTALRDELLDRFPASAVHVVSYDTSTGKLRAVETDPRDESIGPIIETSPERGARWADKGHAGHGVYVGVAYRAWTDARNTYFFVSPGTQTLAADIGIAAQVMLHHSAVDLSSTPMVLHIDYPAPDGVVDGSARKVMDAMLDPIIERLSSPDAVGDALRVVRTATDPVTWKGEIVG